MTTYASAGAYQGRAGGSGGGSGGTDNSPLGRTRASPDVVSTTAQNGTGATFDVVVASDGTPTVTLKTAGTGYAATDTLTIADGNLGAWCC